MSIKNRIAAAGAVFAALATLGVALPQAASAAPVSSDEVVSIASLNACDLRSKIDEIKAWDTNGQYNIMVWKESAQGSVHLNGVVYQDHIRARECGKAFPQDVNYFWAAFHDGEFVLRGDGGFRNWAFHGNWERNGNRVIFHGR
ncbi:hypothetical protein ABT263_35565 [Kitasatospora sp. NPDC001603]|uniref:hypothetical protein n=1 Tax=Kitasatospora sp. NPDC001603 TaxID=3154388 RepID=UPI00331D87E8